MTAAADNSAHCVCLTGYQKDAETLTFVNSWGSKWGNDGYGTMSFRYFEQKLQEAYILLPGINSGLKHEVVCGFGTALPTGRYECLEHWDVGAGVKAGWIIAKIDEGEKHIEIEDLYVQPKYRQRGIGKGLLYSAIDMADDLGLSVAAYISLANTNPNNVNLSPIASLCNRFGFTTTSVNVPWAKYRATRNGTGIHVPIQQTQEPNPPACSLQMLQSLYELD